MSLNAKQELFVEYYLETFNATEAAKRAGYSQKTAYSQGSALLKKPEIQSRVRERIAKVAMNADEVLQRLADQARADMSDFINPDSLTVDLKQAQQKGKLHLVKKIKYITRTDDDSQTETVEFELYDAQKALVTLGRHHGLWTDKLEIDDWRLQAIRDIKEGKITYEALVQSFDTDIASELFRAAGVPVSPE